ncbi:MAG: PH domain-containing protein [Actinomycetota bacterium]
MGAPAVLNDLTDFRRYERYLAGTEQVVYKGHHHFVVLARDILIWLGAIAASILVGFMAETDDRGAPLKNLAVLAFFGSSAWLAFQVVQWRWDEFLITNKRIIKVEGILSRRVSTIPLGKITDTSYRRSILGRILGYGDLVLDLPGQDKYLPVLDKLSHPDDVYQTIMQIAHGGGVPPRPAPPRPPSEDDTGPIPVAD